MNNEIQKAAETQPFVFHHLATIEAKYRINAKQFLNCSKHNIKASAKRLMKHRSACANHHEDLVQWFPPLDHQAGMNA